MLVAMEQANHLAKKRRLSAAKSDEDSPASRGARQAACAVFARSRHSCGTLGAHDASPATRCDRTFASACARWPAAPGFTTVAVLTLALYPKS
jgi:hypothetical protein